MVLQSYALYPHKTVLQNLAFGLRQHKMPTAGVSEERVGEVRELLTLDQGPAGPQTRPALRWSAAARGDGARARPQASASTSSTSRSRTWTHSCGPSFAPTLEQPWGGV